MIVAGTLALQARRAGFRSVPDNPAVGRSGDQLGINRGFTDELRTTVVHELEIDLIN